MVSGSEIVKRDPRCGLHRSWDLRIDSFPDHGVRERRVDTGVPHIARDARGAVVGRGEALIEKARWGVIHLSWFTFATGVVLWFLGKIA